MITVRQHPVHHLLYFRQCIHGCIAPVRNLYHGQVIEVIPEHHQLLAPDDFYQLLQSVFLACALNTSRQYIPL